MPLNFYMGVWGHCKGDCWFAQYLGCRKRRLEQLCVKCEAGFKCLYIWYGSLIYFHNPEGFGNMVIQDSSFPRTVRSWCSSHRIVHGHASAFGIHVQKCCCAFPGNQIVWMLLKWHCLSCLYNMPWVLHLLTSGIFFLKTKHYNLGKCGLGAQISFQQSHLPRVGCWHMRNGLISLDCAIATWRMYGYPTSASWTVVIEITRQDIVLTGTL